MLNDLNLLTFPPVTTSAPEFSILIDDIDLTTAYSAKTAMSVLDARMERIGREIGVLGATEARLSTAADLLLSSRENLLEASSRIMDADVAEEAAALVRTKILQQAGAAVLAQANQEPALALTLLKGLK